MSPISLNQKYHLRRFLGFFLGLLLVIGTLVYIAFQARFLIAGPSIVLDSELEVVQNQRLVMINGHTSNIVNITLNGRQIFTDQAGYFNEALILENGYTKATIVAEDRYERKTKVEQDFVYVPTTDVEPVATIQE